MTVLAAEGDTWGIPGPTFLLLFAGAAALLVIAAVVHRIVLFSGRSYVPVDRLGPQQVAFLHGGERLALWTSLGGLRAAGAIAVEKSVLTPAGPLPAGATPLDTAVYNAAGARVRVGNLRSADWVPAALTQVRESLERAGLVPSPATRRAARVVPLFMLALAGAGAIRLVAGLEAGKPVGGLIGMLALWTVVSLAFLAVVPHSTRGAKRALADLRLRHDHLAPHHAPAYTTYGPVSVAMGVALFGGATVWALDPAFAEAAQIQRTDTAAASSGGVTAGGDAGGGGDGGGGGCGGGGCGGCGG